MLDLRKIFLFPGSNLTTLIDRFSSKFVYVLSNFRPIFSKLCIGVHTRKEWFGVEDGQNSTNKYRVGLQNNFVSRLYLKHLTVGHNR